MIFKNENFNITIFLKNNKRKKLRVCNPIAAKINEKFSGYGEDFPVLVPLRRHL